MQFNDGVRAAFMAVVTSTLSVFVLVGLVHVDSVAQAAITLAVNNATLFAMLLFKKGQSG